MRKTNECDWMSEVVFGKRKTCHEAFPANSGTGGGRGIIYLRDDRWVCMGKTKLMIHACIMIY